MTEQGTIFNIQRFSTKDGPGIRTTVFFKGCPLNCWWCHNPESRRPLPENMNDIVIGRTVTVDELIKEISKDEVFYDESQGGVTLSGGEPVFQPLFLKKLLQKCRDLSFHTAVDTTGYAPYQDFDKINGLVDLYLYDLKLFDDKKHINYTGVSNKIILDNLKKLNDDNRNVTVRIPMIPGITDTDENLDSIINFLIKLKNINKVSLLPYNKLGEDKRIRYHLENKLEPLQSQTEVEIDFQYRRFKLCGYDVKVGG